MSKDTGINQLPIHWQCEDKQAMRHADEQTIHVHDGIMTSTFISFENKIGFLLQQNN